MAPPDPSENGHARTRRRAALNAGLWTRLVIADGVELHVDTSKHNPGAEDLLEIQRLIGKLII